MNLGGKQMIPVRKINSLTEERKETMEKENLIRRFNALNIPGMPEVTELWELKGSFVNLEFPLPSGRTVKLWDDEKMYLGNQLEKKDSTRCYGLTAGDGYLLVCEYGDGGSDPEIVAFQRI